MIGGQFWIDFFLPAVEYLKVFELLLHGRENELLKFFFVDFSAARAVLAHQKKVEIPVEKSVLYQKCRNCNQTAYLKAKERYDTQREKMAGRYKAKTAMYEALMFLLIWYSASTTLFQMIQSKVFISDCRIFFDAIGTFTQTIAGWIALIGKNVAQISNGISNPVVAGIIY